MINEFLSRQFIIFIVTGGTAALVNFISRLIFNQWFSFSTAVIFAYLIGMTTAFVLAKIFVFKETTQSIHYSISFFCLVNILAITQTWLISMGLAYYLLPYIGVSKLVPEIAHAIGIVAPVFTSYIGHKRFSFR